MVDKKTATQITVRLIKPLTYGGEPLAAGVEILVPAALVPWLIERDAIDEPSRVRPAPEPVTETVTENAS